MQNDTEYDSFSTEDFTVEVYKELLNEFDAVMCEALSMNQFTAGRYVAPHIGYGSQIFTRLCIHGECLLSSAPMSRWSKKDFHFWDLSCIAPHVRAIMEGYLLYMYISDEPLSENEWKAKLWTMHMNDCSKRLKLMQSTENFDKANFFEAERDKISGELNSNQFFLELPSSVRKGCLNGKYLMIYSRDELVLKYGLNKNMFDNMFDILSNYIHILPISYYSHEPNKRGSGLFNDTDLGYMCMCLGIVIHLIRTCNDRLEDFFPDSGVCRKGKKSTFSPGPKENLPQLVREHQNRNKKKKRKK